MSAWIIAKSIAADVAAEAYKWAVDHVRERVCNAVKDDVPREMIESLVAAELAMLVGSLENAVGAFEPKYAIPPLGDEVAIEAVTEWQCDECGDTFDRLVDYNAHKKLHDEIRDDITRSNPEREHDGR